MRFPLGPGLDRELESGSLSLEKPGKVRDDTRRRIRRWELCDPGAGVTVPIRGDDIIRIWQGLLVTGSREQLAGPHHLYPTYVRGGLMEVACPPDEK